MISSNNCLETKAINLEKLFAKYMSKKELPSKIERLLKSDNKKHLFVCLLWECMWGWGMQATMHLWEVRGQPEKAQLLFARCGFGNGTQVVRLEVMYLSP